MCNVMETYCTYMLHGHTLKSATSDYDQRHVIAFRPISIAARSWSYDKVKCYTSYEMHIQSCFVVERIYKPYLFSHKVATSSAEYNRCNSSMDCGQLLTICDIVWHLPQGHMSVAARFHFF